MGRPWGGTNEPLESVGGDAPRPHVPSTAEKALHEPQSGMQSNDDPAEVLDAAFRRESGRAIKAARALPKDTADLVTRWDAVMRDYDIEGNGFESQLERIQDSTLFSPDVKAQLLADARAEGEAKVAQKRRVAEAHLEVLEAALMSEAMPKFDHARESFIRQELDVMLRDHPQPVQRMLEIAGGPDRAAAGVLLKGLGTGSSAGSGLSEAYLSRLPFDQRRAQRDLLRGAAIRGSLQHGTAHEKAAAEALLPENAAGLLNRIKAAQAARFMQKQLSLEKILERRPR
jgi:hypothetical protein